MIAAVALAAALAAQPPGADKVKHFFMSALIHSATFSIARAAGISRPNAQVAGAVATLTAGVVKEGWDRRRGRAFSTADLVWDAAGALAAASLLNGTR